MDCIFCKIIKKEIPSKILHETKLSMAFLDAFPLTKGHTLVIPKSHHEKIQDMTKDENADLFETVRTILPKIDKLTNATLIAIHNGKESGQEIPHVHVHLIPRNSKDGAGSVHSMFKNKISPSSDEMNSLHEMLKS